MLQYIKYFVFCIFILCFCICALRCNLVKCITLPVLIDIFWGVFNVWLRLFSADDSEWQIFDFAVVIKLLSPFNDVSMLCDVCGLVETDDIRGDNTCDDDGDGEGCDRVKCGLNGLPSLDGIGRIRPAVLGVLANAWFVGVLVDISMLSFGLLSNRELWKCSLGEPTFRDAHELECPGQNTKCLICHIWIIFSNIVLHEITWALQKYIIMIPSMPHKCTLLITIVLRHTNKVDWEEAHKERKFLSSVFACTFMYHSFASTYIIGEMKQNTIIFLALSGLSVFISFLWT